MATRLFNLSASLSAAACCLLVAASPSASNVDPRKQFLSLSRGCHFSIDARGADARLALFDNAAYGPYSGSIIAITSPGRPSGVRVTSFGDTAGVYYRFIRWPDGRSLWTLSLSLLYPLAASALLPIIWLIRRPYRPRRDFPVHLEDIAPQRVSTPEAHLAPNRF